MKNFFTLPKYIGGVIPNVVVIAVFVAMFKRRHQAFSYVILWMLQTFLENFFKLVTLQPRPSIYINSDVEGVPWTSSTSIIDLGSPSSTALTSMSLGLSLVIEYINHT